MPAEKGRMTSLDEQIVELEGGPWYRRAEIARLLGVTPSAVLEISRSPRHEEFAPTSYIEWAGKIVHLWHGDAVAKLREHFERTSGVGRPRTWTPEETALRRRRGDLMRYYHRSAGVHLAAGNHEKAAKAQAKASSIRRELDSQLAGRKSDLQAEAALNEESED